ncbi:hypothetical protein WDZ92_49200, partial [Nostoc sp. NIES-2111]
LPVASLAVCGGDPDKARRGVTHPPGVWRGTDPVREMTVFSPSNEMTISLLIYPDASPTFRDMAALEEEAVPDAFDRFTNGSTR